MSSVLGADWTWSCGSKFFTLHSSLPTLFTFNVAKVQNIIEVCKGFANLFSIYLEC